eukprot:TRINITY_DN34763_c0_g1_i1.p1 TRINITY_DN34763_c0_g1~~TRINITY_DN34763_c0_g1_i1.p1  ORF type:complete len:425 (+),score=48.55 TRINITY_DN34763_c0_g1_i1:68-1276(+)
MAHSGRTALERRMAQELVDEAARSRAARPRGALVNSLYSALLQELGIDSALAQPPGAARGCAPRPSAVLPECMRWRRPPGGVCEPLPGWRGLPGRSARDLAADAAEEALAARRQQSLPCKFSPPRQQASSSPLPPRLWPPPLEGGAHSPRGGAVWDPCPAPAPPAATPAPAVAAPYTPQQPLPVAPQHPPSVPRWHAPQRPAEVPPAPAPSPVWPPHPTPEAASSSPVAALVAASQRGATPLEDPGLPNGRQHPRRQPPPPTGGGRWVVEAAQLGGNRFRVSASPPRSSRCAGIPQPRHSAADSPQSCAGGPPPCPGPDAAPAPAPEDPPAPQQERWRDAGQVAAESARAMLRREAHHAHWRQQPPPRAAGPKDEIPELSPQRGDDSQIPLTHSCAPRAISF